MQYFIMVTLFVFFCNTLYIVVDGTEICTEDTSVLFRNLSLGKPSHQSSSLDSVGNASKGNDGDKNANYDHGSCSHTSEILDNHWWQVDLQDKYNVTSVTIVNRDILGYRLHDFGIEVSLSDQDDGNGRLMEAHVCHYHEGAGIGDEQTFPCTSGGVEGQYLRIFKTNVTATGDPLTLCEVGVSGYKVICEVPSTSLLSTTNVGSTHSSWTNTNKASSPSTTGTMTYPATTTDPTPCNCRCVNTTTPTMSELVERVEQLKKQLTVNRKTTSSYIRKFISAPDNRTSARSIGAVLGAGVLIFVFGSIVAMDLPRLKHFLLSK